MNKIITNKNNNATIVHLSHGTIDPRGWWRTRGLLVLLVPKENEEPPAGNEAKVPKFTHLFVFFAARSNSPRSVCSSQQSPALWDYS